MSLEIGFLILDGFSNMVLASAVEPLRVARDHAGTGAYGWRLFSAGGQPPVSSSGLHLGATEDIATARDLDMLFVIAGYGAREQARPALIKALQLAERRIKVIGALDSGSWLLAAAGLLSGYRATVHWQDIAGFAESHIDVEVVGDRFVIDRNRITAGGATTVIDLMLRLITEHGGRALAFDVSNMFVYDTRQTSGEDRGARRHALTARVPQVVRAIDAMRANVEQPLSLDALAQHAAVSKRTLIRLFQREFGMAPGQFYQNIRLNAARALAEETRLTAHEIAMRCGFSSAATLSRAHRLHFSLTLTEARKMRRGAVR